MIDLLVLVTAATVTGLLVFYKPLARSDTWLATVTPLASIMGSGFLVCAPLLAKTVGIHAAPAMGLLLLLAYAVGSALRFTIRHTEALLSGGDAPVPVQDTTLTDQRLFHAHKQRVAWMQTITGLGPLKVLEALSQVLLALAYLISVTY